MSFSPDRLGISVSTGNISSFALVGLGDLPLGKFVVDSSGVESGLGVAPDLGGVAGGVLPPPDALGGMPGVVGAGVAVIGVGAAVVGACQFFRG